MRVSINVLMGNGNAMRVCDAMVKGIRAAGDFPVKRTVGEQNMQGFDAAFLWGFTTECQQVVVACQKAGIPWVFADNGYQLRTTHFKVTVNNRHPDAYLPTMHKPSNRMKEWGIGIAPRRVNRKGTDPIIVAGMSPKAAWSFGFAFEEYERATIAALRQHTLRPIIYRPKVSNSPGAKSIEGATLEGKESIAGVLARAHCVVTHHSNVACDALLAGVPVFTRLGAARCMGQSDTELHLIEDPVFPESREQWASNLAYCQWSLNEMASGECWREMRELFGK